MDSTSDKIYFLRAEKVDIYDDLLREERITNTRLIDDSGNPILQCVLFNSKKSNDINTVNLLSYLMTYIILPDINSKNKAGRTALWVAVLCNDIDAVKLLLDFGADRTIKSDSNTSYPMTTPLQLAIKKKYDRIATLLKVYIPSEEEKLTFQLDYKRRIDDIFKGICCHYRFEKRDIDLKYMSIHAVKTGDLNLLIQSIPHVDLQTAFSLFIVAIEKNYFHLIDCLLKKLVSERIFQFKNDNSIEQLLYIGLNPSFQKHSDEVIHIINRSRILSLFKILYHKFVYLDINFIFELVQVLLYELLY
jgi:hypothetical protein